MSGMPVGPYDDAARRCLAPAAAGAGLFETALCFAQLFLLDGTTQMIMVAVSGGSALLLFGGWLVLRRVTVAAHFAHGLLALIVLLVAGGAIAHMLIAEAPRQTSLVMLAVVGAGAVLLSLRYLAATLYLIWGVWALAAVLLGPSPVWPDYVAGMVAATVLGLGIGQMRRRSIDEVHLARKAAETAAVRDQLTGVANRRGLAMVGSQIVELARRQGDAVHCIFVGVESLDRVNRVAGHRAGEDVLVSVAEALRAVTRGTDVVARWGSSEFCVVGPGPGMAPLDLERRVRDYVFADVPVAREVWGAEIGAGGAMLTPWDPGTLDTLLGKADQEMCLRRSLRRASAPPSPRTAVSEEQGPFG